MTTFCPYCFSDKSFRQRLKEVRPEFPRSLKCDFHPNRSGLPAEAVAKIVDGVFREHFVIGDTDPVYDRDDDRPNWEQRGDPLDQLIDEITSAESFEITEALKDQLIEDDDADPRDGEEPFYADDQLYAAFDLTWNPHSAAWTEFKREVTHNRRFFSNLAVQRLDEIFRDIHFQSDQDGRQVVYALSPDEKKNIYRVRQIDVPEDRKKAADNPAAELGVPPPRKRTAGRMNAAGVGAFYASFDLKTCIAEIRPPVGSVIMGAAFELIRPIVVLDTTRFAKPIRNRSLFSPVFQERVHQWKFMKRFMNEISRPILPHDTNIDYVPSQAVSEYIHSQLKVPRGKNKVGIDGIIFASAQRPNTGLNIVLFGDAAQVEQVPGSDRPSSYEATNDDWTENWTEWKPKPSQPALRLVANSVITRRISSVEFDDDYYSEWDFEED